MGRFFKVTPTETGSGFRQMPVEGMYNIINQKQQDYDDTLLKLQTEIAPIEGGLFTKEAANRVNKKINEGIESISQQLANDFNVDKAASNIMQFKRQIVQDTDFLNSQKDFAYWSSLEHDDRNVYSNINIDGTPTRQLQEKDSWNKSLYSYRPYMDVEQSIDITMADDLEASIIADYGDEVELIKSNGIVVGIREPGSTSIKALDLTNPYIVNAINSTTETLLNTDNDLRANFLRQVFGLNNPNAYSPQQIEGFLNNPEVVNKAKQYVTDIYSRRFYKNQEKKPGQIIKNAYDNDGEEGEENVGPILETTKFDININNSRSITTFEELVGSLRQNLQGKLENSSKNIIDLIGYAIDPETGKIPENITNRSYTYQVEESPTVTLSDGSVVENSNAWKGSFEISVKENDGVYDIQVNPKQNTTFKKGNISVAPSEIRQKADQIAADLNRSFRLMQRFKKANHEIDQQLVQEEKEYNDNIEDLMTVTINNPNKYLEASPDRIKGLPKEQFPRVKEFYGSSFSRTQIKEEFSNKIDPSFKEFQYHIDTDFKSEDIRINRETQQIIDNLILNDGASIEEVRQLLKDQIIQATRVKNGNRAGGNFSKEINEKIIKYAFENNNLGSDYVRDYIQTAGFADALKNDPKAFVSFEQIKKDKKKELLQKRFDNEFPELANKITFIDLESSNKDIPDKEVHRINRVANEYQYKLDINTETGRPYNRALFDDIIGRAYSAKNGEIYGEVNTEIKNRDSSYSIDILGYGIKNGKVIAYGDVIHWKQSEKANNKFVRDTDKEEDPIFWEMDENFSKSLLEVITQSEEGADFVSILNSQGSNVGDPNYVINSQNSRLGFPLQVNIPSGNDTGNKTISFKLQNLPAELQKGFEEHLDGKGNIVLTGTDIQLATVLGIIKLNQYQGGQGGSSMGKPQPGDRR